MERPAPPPGPRPFPVRWAIAGVVTLAVVAVAVGAWFLLSQAPVKTVAAAWLPSDTVAYLELSADLTAEQRDKVLGLLKDFPGFADQARLGDKLDESAQQLLGKADLDYRAQIKTWLGDGAAVAFRVPAAGETMDGPAALLLVSTNDSAARAFVKTIADRAAKAGADVLDETAGGILLTTLMRPDGSGAMRPRAFAVVDGRLVAGDPYLVRAAIAVRREGAPALASRDAFRQAIGSLPHERVGALWVDAAGLLQAARSELETLAPGNPALGLLTFEPGSALVGFVRAEADGVVLEMTGRGSISAAALLSPPPGTSPRASRLAGSAPPGTAILLDVHDVGPRIRAALDAARLAGPSSTDVLGQVDRALAAFGTNLDELTGAIGDGAVVITLDDHPRAAVVVQITQPAVASRLVSQIDALLGLSGLGRVSTSEYHGVTLHRVQMTSGTLPDRNSTPTYALAGDEFIVGLDEEIVTAVIDARNAGTGLTADANYQAVNARIGAENNGAFYVDLGALLKAFGGDRFSAETRAFLEPFRVFGGATRAPAEHEWLGTSRFFVLVR